MSELDGIVSEYNVALHNFQKQIQDKLDGALKQFFVEHPEFRSIEWVQYTPYFNDGDPCEFRMGEIGYTAQPEFYADGGAFLEDYSTYDLEENTPFSSPSDYMRRSNHYADEVAAYDALPEEEKANRERLELIWKRFSGTLCGVPEDIYRGVFGDHKHIKITKDGTTVADYDHD